MSAMTARSPIDPAGGEVFLDARGDGRALRLRWHPEADVVVLSLWRDGVCAGTFRLPQAEVATFVDALVDGLRELREPGAAPAQPVSPPLVAAPLRITDTQPIAMPAQPAFVDWAFGPADDSRVSAG